MLKVRFLLALAVVVMMCGVVPPVHAQGSYVVTNTNNSGAGSLRDAITWANSNSGSDTITFNIDGAGVQTITLASALPAITEPVIIDGLSQGTTCTSWPPATLLIELNGNNISANGLAVDATGGGSTITGLIINRFTGSGIRLSGGASSTISCNYVGTDSAGTGDSGNTVHGVYIGGSASNIIAGNLISGNGQNGVYIMGSAGDSNQVRGNYIGVQLDGASRLANDNSGVLISGAGVEGNTIGGNQAQYRNIISGNGLSGVTISEGAAENMVLGNYIGTQVNGVLARANGWSGVYIDGASNNIVGGTSAAERNILSGNTYYGVYIGGATATGNRVLGNYIGTGVTGTELLGNALGVYVLNGASGNDIGGPSAGEGNVIMNNGYGGVGIGGGTGNLVSSNSISANVGLGIDLGTAGVTSNDAGDGDGGPNNLQNFPVLTSVTVNGGQTRIQGTLNSTAGTQFTIEFFYSLAPDPTTYGEGGVLIGSGSTTTNGSGNASIDFTFPTAIPAGTYVSATATDPGRNTSEFSQVRYFPTAVTLWGFSAEPAAQGIMIEWTTSAETENLGFNLYRAECAAGDRARLNDTLIPSQLPGSPTGAHYTWMDDEVFPGITYCYWLEDVSIDGASGLEGPVFGGPLPYRHYLPLLSR